MKANRRTVLKLGVAASTLPLATAAIQPVFAGATGHAENLELYKILFDKTSNRGREFGCLSQRLGAQVEAIEGDVTDIWYNDLYFRWKEGQAAIAGLTTETTLFCLQQLARDVKMHVVYRAEHSRSDDPGVIADAAHLIVNYPLRGLVRRMPTDSVWPGRYGQDDEQLVSWIIAPLT
jgi:hypothetical protein